MPRKSLFVSPSLWSDDELERDRRAAINRFVSSFLDSGANAYRAHYDELYPLVESLFSDTDDLTQLVHVVSELSKQADEQNQAVGRKPP